MKIQQLFNQKYGLLLFCLFLIPLATQAQGDLKISVEPEELTLKMNETAQLKVKVTDAEGKEITEGQIYYYSTNQRIVETDKDGQVKAIQPGTTRVIVLKPDANGKYVRKNVPVTVLTPPLTELSFVNLPSSMYSKTTQEVKVSGKDAFGFTRSQPDVSYKTSNPEIAQFDEFNNLKALKSGKVSIVAQSGDTRASQEIEIKSNPVSELKISASSTEARTGDVIQFSVQALDKSNKLISDAPIAYSFVGKSADVSNSASGLIRKDGRFVAEQAGMYTITATCGDQAIQKTVKISPRKVKKKIELVGRGVVNDKHTSDLWVWEGIDGKDYAVTGTWGADGEAYFWDVTEPANIVLIDTFKVDARTVNDVKVSEDGKTCIISREGASNRKNGIVILDVTNPRDVKLHSEFNEGLTGGVHNLFIYKDHVYALSNGERYDVINISNPKTPKKVGTFELSTKGHAIHDVWIENGIAYSSNWHDGVQLVDVGNGIKGGSPEKPVQFAEYAYPSGWNHAAFPFDSPSTGKRFVIAGDEAFPNGLFVKDKPTIPAGYLHVIDFSDLDNPLEIAKYEVPGAGSHNFWIDGETLYVANYNAGLRIVDISGDLMGDLYRQGREMATFLPTDPKAIVPNAAMTWGPQPHKGHIFFSDWNSGLWAVKITEDNTTP